MYEYKIFSVPTAELIGVFTNHEGNLKEYVLFLNKASEQGWELVHALGGNDEQKYAPTQVVMRRQKEADLSPEMKKALENFTQELLKKQECADDPLFFRSNNYPHNR